MVFRASVACLCLAVSLSISAKAQSPPFSSDNQLMRMPEPGVREDSNMSGFRSGGSISGAVVTQDNRPVGNARVEIRDTVNGSSVAIGYTSPAGTFQLDNVPRGTYEVVADFGISETREDVRMNGAPMQFTLRLPHTADASVHGGSQTISVQQLSTPEKAQNAFRKAQDSLAKGKLDEAKKEVTKALDIAPKYSDAVTLRGVISLQSGDIKSATNDLQEAIQLDDNNAMAYVAMASVYNLQGQFDNALRELERGSALDPRAWQAPFEMSKAHLGKGQYSDCLADLRKAEELLGQRTMSGMHVVRGEALFGMKAYAQAATEFQKFLSEDKDSPAAPSVRKALEQARAASEEAKK